MSSQPPRFKKLDEVCCNDHYYLSKNDECYYLGEYTRRKGYEYSDINSIILNLKKSPLLKNYAEYAHKENAIKKVSTLFFEGINKAIFSQSTFVPIPPSKAKSDSDHDDRMLKICLELKNFGIEVDVIELIINKESLDASHRSQDRTSAEILIKNYSINPDIPTDCSPRNVIFLVDDVLTTGTHFLACKRYLTDHYPKSRIIGLFVARRIFGCSNDFDDFDDFDDLEDL